MFCIYSDDDVCVLLFGSTGHPHHGRVLQAVHVSRSLRWEHCHHPAGAAPAPPLTFLPQA